MNLIGIFILFLLKSRYLIFHAWGSHLCLLHLLSTADFSPQEVFDHLISIDISKACVVVLMQSLVFLLQAGAEFICSPLSFLFTTSMFTVTLPKDWVTVNVGPVFKHDDCLVVKNYRPISLTSLVIKTMERIIYW